MPRGIEILYLDAAVIVIDKPPGLASVPVKGLSTPSALEMLRTQLPPGRVFVVHFLPINVDAETDGQAWGATLHLSGRHRLTLYDAACLELALRRGLPLASLDAELRGAAQAEGRRPWELSSKHL